MWQTVSKWKPLSPFIHKEDTAYDTNGLRLKISKFTVLNAPLAIKFCQKLFVWWGFWKTADEDENKNGTQNNKQREENIEKRHWKRRESVKHLST